MKKKAISICMVLALFISLIPWSVFADTGIDNNSKPVLVLKAKQLVKGRKIKVRLNWNITDKTNKYVVYACEKGKRIKRIKTLKGNINTFDVRKINKKKLEPKKVYLFRVNAYDENNSLLTKTRIIRYITSNIYRKFSNAKSISVDSTLSMEKGSSTCIKYDIKRYRYKNKKKKPIYKFRGVSSVYFISDNKAVAKVTLRGKVKAMSKGTANIYMQEVSGLWSKVRVTVTDNGSVKPIPSSIESLQKINKIKKKLRKKKIEKELDDLKKRIRENYPYFIGNSADAYCDLLDTIVLKDEEYLDQLQDNNMQNGESEKLIFKFIEKMKIALFVDDDTLKLAEELNKMDFTDPSVPGEAYLSYYFVDDAEHDMGHYYLDDNLFFVYDKVIECGHIDAGDVNEMRVGIYSLIQRLIDSYDGDICDVEVVVDELGDPIFDEFGQQVERSKFHQIYDTIGNEIDHDIFVPIVHEVIEVYGWPIQTPHFRYRKLTP